MSENGEIYTAGKKFTLPPALTALTNSTSAWRTCRACLKYLYVVLEMVVDAKRLPFCPTASTTAPSLQISQYLEIIFKHYLNI